MASSASLAQIEQATRQLSYDEGDNKLLQDFRFGGPALGVTFRF